MKIKKLIASITAAAVVLSTGATALTACKSGCDHKYTWKETKPATCIEEGERQGLCGLCGDVITETTDKSTTHNYGEWEIVKPDETTEGKATKVCGLSEEHVKKVTLPVITSDGSGYDSSAVTTPPTALSEGLRTFVLKDADGDITFTLSVPATGVESVSDAVEVAKAHKNLIRKVSGAIFIPSTEGATPAPSDYYYEFGDNYTHIVFDGDDVEYWCSLDDNDKIYAIKSNNGTIAQETNANQDLINGYGFSIAYAGGRFFYGVEDLISGLYEWGQAAESQDFYEKCERVNGSFVYEFGFGYLSGFYNVMSLTFTLTTSGAVNTVDFKGKVYGSGKWTADEDGKNVTLVEGATPNGVETITATTVLKASEEGKETPVNPYPSNWTQLKSFDLSYGGKILTEETVVEIKADALVKLEVINVKNVGDNISNLNYDPLSVYLRKDGKDVKLDAVVPDDGVSAYVSGTTVNIRSHIVGDVTLVVKSQSGNASRILKLNVSYSIPGNRSLAASVYEYGDLEYVWNITNTATVYVGEKLLVMAVAAPNEAYVDTTVTAQVTDTALNPMDSSLYTLSGGGSEYEFSATQTSTYIIGLTSIHNSRASIAITVTVIAPPAISTVLYGSYSANVEYPSPDTVTVTFKPSSTTGSGTVEVSDSRGTETLNYVWDGKELTTTYAGGAEFGYLIQLNEKYKPVILHATGFGDTESVVLQRMESN